MERNRRYTGRTAAAGLFGLALLVASCTDRGNPVAPVGETGGGPGTQPPGTPVELQTLECKGNARAKTISCDLPGSSGGAGGASQVIIPGPNHVYVDVNSSNANYDGGLGRFTFDVSVRNRIGQSIGTADGVTLDPTGVRVFFMTAPTVTSGTGAITVVGDGTETFTAANQPYYQYNEVLSPLELSPSKQWRLDMPSTVNTFSFLLKVSAPVQFPNGWVATDPSVYSMPALQIKNIGLKVFDVFGRVDSTTTPTFTPADPSIAVAGPVEYVPGTGSFTVPILGLRSGTVAINASGPTLPTIPMTLNVGGIQRLWRGTESSDYNNAANWRAVNLLPNPVPGWIPASVLQGVPSSVDTAVVHTDSATVFPVMAQNNTVGGVMMVSPTGDPTPATINLSSFDYTLTSSIDQDDSGQILGTGRMIFTGTAKTISGGLSNVDYRNARFTGTYSLDANLNVTGGRIVVQGGRLRNQGFRIRVRPN